MGNRKSISTLVRRQSAAGTAAALAIAASATHGAIVTSCSDDGPGSLRSVVSAAASGDTIDLSGLSCFNSSLTLTTGAIVVDQASLTLLGPGSSALTIRASGFQASHDNGVIDHQGSGTLTVEYLAIADGFGHYSALYKQLAGGCIYSRGNVLLSHARVANCNADTFATGLAATSALGGGVFALGKATLVNSTVESNYVGADPAAQPNSSGGGVYALGNFVAKYSTISGNSAGFTTVLGTAGGIAASGSVTIANSTVSYNAASYSVGGIYASGVNGGSLTITNSTISGNNAPQDGGLFSTSSGNIYNSTIAFNRKTATTGNSAGATFSAAFGPTTVGLYSTLISNNTYLKNGTTTSNDISVAPSAHTVTFKGVDNLIRAPAASVPMSSFLSSYSGVCPLLGPLRDNGGPTMTHALNSRSPAIGHGGGTPQYDQRGPGYARKSGSAIDIGAYEVQDGDVIFNSSLEGCP